MKRIIGVWVFFLTAVSAFASSEHANWVQFNLAFEPILSNTAAVYDLVGPGSTVGAHDSYLMGGWKIGFDYDLSPMNQIGVGFKSITGADNFSFKDAHGNLDVLNTNSLGLYVEGRRGLKLFPHLDASVFSDIGYYWLNNSNYLTAAQGSSNLSGGTWGVLLGVGLNFWADSAGVYGFGLDFGYQFLNFSSVSTPKGPLLNFDGSQGAVDMSGFVFVLNFAEISLDLTPKPPKTFQSYPEIQPKPSSDVGPNPSAQTTPMIPDFDNLH